MNILEISSFFFSCFFCTFHNKSTFLLFLPSNYFDIITVCFRFNIIFCINPLFSHSFLATGPFGGSCQIHGPIPMPQSESEELSTTPIDAETGDHPSGIKSPIISNPPKPPAFSHSYCPPEIHRSCFCVRFIAEHTKMQEDSTKVRLLLYIIHTSYIVCGA